jgi:hypothetical protein
MNRVVGQVRVALWTVRPRLAVRERAGVRRFEVPIANFNAVLPVPNTS